MNATEFFERTQWPMARMKHKPERFVFELSPEEYRDLKALINGCVEMCHSPRKTKAIREHMQYGAHLSSMRRIFIDGEFDDDEVE